MAIPARRRAADITAFVFATLATALGLIFLFWILWMTLRQGAAALRPSLRDTASYLRRGAPRSPRRSCAPATF